VLNGNIVQLAQQFSPEHLRISLVTAEGNTDYRKRLPEISRPVFSDGQTAEKGTVPQAICWPASRRRFLPNLLGLERKTCGTGYCRADRE
jgi:hypothetical protein